MAFDYITIEGKPKIVSARKCMVVLNTLLHYMNLFEYLYGGQIDTLAATNDYINDDY